MTNFSAKIPVTHEPSMVLLKSTSYVGTNEGMKVTVTFKPKEAVEANFRRVWNSPVYQAHLTAKEKQRAHYEVVFKDGEHMTKVEDNVFLK
jgi:hypothetical protein